MKSKSLLDLMSPEDRDRAIERGKKRIERRRERKGLEVSPEIYEICEFGYYFGWEAVMAVRRNYTVSPTGEKEPISMEEVQVLLEGARKVWRTKLMESAGATMASTISAFSKNPRQTLDSQLENFREMAKVTE